MQEIGIKLNGGLRTKGLFDKKSELINLSSGFEISIKELVNLIVKFTGFKGDIIWDATKPNGQPGRMMDGSRAEKKFGFRANVKFEEGVEDFGLG